MGKQKDIKVTKAILSEETPFIKPKESFKSNRNNQNSSYNKPLKMCNDYEILHNGKVMTGNTIYSIKNKTQIGEKSWQIILTSQKYVKLKLL